MVPCDDTSSSDYWCCGSSKDCCGTPAAIKIAQVLGEPTTTSSASTAGSTTTSSPTGSQPSSQQSSGPSTMSTGAKAGIGVGVSVGVIAVGGFLVFLFRRRTNKAAGKGSILLISQPLSLWSLTQEAFMRCRHLGILRNTSCRHGQRKGMNYRRNGEEWYKYSTMKPVRVPYSHLTVTLRYLINRQCVLLRLGLRHPSVHVYFHLTPWN